MAGARISRAIGGGIFGTDAAGYHGARLDYPAALFDRLEAYSGGLRGSNVFEVGAGTGIATRALSARGPARLTIIEPDPILAARLGADGYETVNDGFEAAVTPVAQYDVGVAASSIHWVDPVLAHGRARALLRAGGTWAIWWNVYRAAGIGDAFADALLPRLEAVAMPPSEAPYRHYSLDEDEHREALAAAGFGDVEFRAWRRERMLSAPEMRALYETFSFIRVLPADDRAATLDLISELVHGEFAGLAPNVVLTPLYLARAQ
jgi:SAM-dependent methyltransferase